MKHTERSIEAGRKMAEAAIRLQIEEIPSFIAREITTFRLSIDMENIEERQEMSAMLSIASTLLLNYDINSGQYLFGEKEIEKSRTARSEIAKEAAAMREAGI
jgi:hypothetical protein